MDTLLKTGTNSIILGKNNYEKYIPYVENKLLKLTKIIKNHDEYKNLSKIREISNYNNYYSIPEEVSYLLNPKDNFYIVVKKLVENYDINIFGSTISCSYVSYAGNKDLYETIIDIDELSDFSLWRSYQKIIEFTETILKAINYLHQNKICHLDIKPENIVINTCSFTFKIIDFGFSSIEPFNDFVKDMRGSSGYFPHQLSIENPKPFLPLIKANDMIKSNGTFPFQKNRNLIYKIDSYCFGRVLYYLKYIYKENRIYYAQPFVLERKQEYALDNIIDDLLENNVHKRLTIEKCLMTHFGTV